MLALKLSGQSIATFVWIEFFCSTHLTTTWTSVVIPAQIAISSRQFFQDSLLVFERKPYLQKGIAKMLI